MFRSTEKIIGVIFNMLKCDCYKLYIRKQNGTLGPFACYTDHPEPERYVYESGPSGTILPHGSAHIYTDTVIDWLVYNL